jgi:hypothetical protein
VSGDLSVKAPRVRPSSLALRMARGLRGVSLALGQIAPRATDITRAPWGEGIQRCQVISRSKRPACDRRLSSSVRRGDTEVSGDLSVKAPACDRRLSRSVCAGLKRCQNVYRFLGQSPHVRPTSLALRKARGYRGVRCSLGQIAPRMTDGPRAPRGEGLWTCQF